MQASTRRIAPCALLPGLLGGWVDGRLGPAPSQWHTALPLTPRVRSLLARSTASMGDRKSSSPASAWAGCKKLRAGGNQDRRQLQRHTRPWRRWRTAGAGAPAHRQRRLGRRPKVATSCLSFSPLHWTRNALLTAGYAAALPGCGAGSLNACLPAAQTTDSGLWCEWCASNRPSV